MSTPAAPQDLYSYCTMLHVELQRLHDRLDLLQHGDAAASTAHGHHWRPLWDGTHWMTGTSRPPTPTPTPAVIAVGHTNIPLAEALPTATDSPNRYSCTLVVPDAVVGHIVGRGGKGLHQAHDVSGAQLRAYTDKALPTERRVSIRGTDQQIGEALIALGKRFMRKRVRTKKKGPSHPSEGPAPPPAQPAPVPPHAPIIVDPKPPGRRARAPAFGNRAQGASHRDDGGRQHAAAAGAHDPLAGRVRFAPQQSLPPPSQPLPRGPAATTSSIPMQATTPPDSTFRHSSTPFAPSVTMTSPPPLTGGMSTAAGSPMVIDAVATGHRRKQTARRGMAPQDVRVVGDRIYFRDDPGF
ncbi:hypothetical protein DFH06DRAFT_1136092 [Mycena polygramma]|nr:hypothetical protein DFH06DRAFT_1136092 [Mycena polygramma]